jgi:hypothetical protein
MGMPSYKDFVVVAPHALGQAGDAGHGDALPTIRECGVAAAHGVEPGMGAPGIGIRAWRCLPTAQECGVAAASWAGVGYGEGGHKNAGMEMPLLQFEGVQWPHPKQPKI